MELTLLKSVRIQHISVREKMKDDATIWISGTMHNIFSVGQILNE